MIDSQTDYDSALKAGLILSEVRHVEDHPFVVIPDQSHVKSLEEFLPRPKRIQETVTCDDLESFIKYVGRFTTEETVIFARGSHKVDASFKAVFDYHHTQPGWGHHTAIYAPIPTEEWMRWRLADKARMRQAELGAFLEENLKEIVEPNGATLVEIARRLEATSTVKFASGHRLQNGNVELRYEEVTQARVGEKGTLHVPEMFAIGLALFEGGAAYRIDCRLKYTIREGQLQIWYELVNPYLVVKDALKQMCERIEKETGVPLFRGRRGNL
jgi:uncharacterized protein YfdQ (DUF2303 family)